MPVEESQFIHVRIPRDRERDLKALAKMNYRSIPAQVLAAIDDSIQSNRQLLKSGKRLPNSNNRKTP